MLLTQLLCLDQQLPQLFHVLAVHREHLLPDAAGQLVELLDGCERVAVDAQVFGVVE